MKRLIKYLFLAAVIGGAMVAVSYAGSRATVGKFLSGGTPSLGTRTITFAYEGVEDLPDAPRAWVYTYEPTEVPRFRRVRLFVSPTGQLLGTIPENLDDILERYRATLP